MSEQQIGTAMQEQSAPEGYTSWNSYWTAQGMPWRTEPEISEDQQKYLDERRKIVKPDIEKGIYPFRDIKLYRADVEWLLATHESGRGPVIKGESGRQRLDLRGADLRKIDLNGLPLTGVRGGLGPQEWQLVGPEERNWAATRLEGANLRRACLEDSFLNWGHLEGAGLYQAHLDGAFLRDAHLEKADLREAHLKGAELNAAHLEGANVREAHLDGAVIRRVFCDAGTALNGATLGDPTHGFVSLSDVHWGETNLAIIRWDVVTILGDERRARMREDVDGKVKDGATRLAEFETAVRANRQLGIALRTQGLNEQADRFAYRAQALQRQVLRRQGQYGRAFGSWLLDLVSGYGYKPIRSVITYLFVILGFAAAYFVVTNFALIPLLTSHASHLAWYEAVVLSISSFHGRGFFPSGFSLGDPVAILAAGEAIIGLLIEITFIATFTQRFFAR